ncbi:hypothetical protein Tco_0410823 [Tanacetum coccineum]
MTTPVEKRIANKLWEFHGEVGHNTDECFALKGNRFEEMLSRKLSPPPWLRGSNKTTENEHIKVTKKGETVRKDKAMAILMVQPWERVARQRIK